MSGKVRRATAILAILATAVAPAAQAEPGPGSGETFFVEYMTRVFTPPTSEAAAWAVIPLAQQVCEVRAQGQSDLEAANVVLERGGVHTLGLASGSEVDDAKTALDVVNAATLAYCPQYNASIGVPVAPSPPVE